MSWRGWRDFVFPMLQKRTADERAADKAALDRDRETINQSRWKQHIEVALDEARGLADAEEQRRRGADQKASTYLAVVAALVPLILTVATSIWDGKAGSVPTWINLALLAIAVVFVAAAGIWAFRVLKVAPAARVGTIDLVSAWTRAGPRAALVRDILWCTRLNHPQVNEKVSGIKMAHAFLLRAFLAFAALLLFNIGASLVEQLRPAGSPDIRSWGVDPWLASPARRAQAVAKVEDLRAQLRGGGPATAILDRWCAAHGLAREGAVTIDKLADGPAQSSSALRRLLHIGPEEPLVFRHVRLRCGDHVLSEAALWYVPGRLPEAINIALRRGVPPFGRVVAPLRVSLTPLSSRLLWPAAEFSLARGEVPNELFEEQAMLSLPDGAPIAYVREVYRRGVLDFSPR